MDTLNKRPKNTYEPKTILDCSGFSFVSLANIIPADAAVTKLELPAKIPEPSAHAEA